MVKSKKGITQIVAISLLILVGIISYFVVQNWFFTYKSSFEVLTESKDLDDEIEVLKLYDSSITINNNFKEKLIVNDIKIDKVSCVYNELNLSIGENHVPISNCLNTSISTLQVVEVLLFTDYGVLQEYEVPLGTLNPLTVDFSSTPCPLDYTNLYHLEAPSATHVELPTSSNFTYNVCVKHGVHNLGNTCSGNYETLFYLDQESNSHGHRVNTSSYYSSWYPVCLNSNSGTIVSSINSTAPTNSSVCIGSFDGIDDDYGVHMGQCSAYSLKLWIDIT